MYRIIKVTLMLLVLFSLLAWIRPANATVEKPPEATMQELKNTLILHIGPCVWKQKERGCVIGRDRVNGTYYIYILDDDRNITHVIRNRNDVETILWVRKDQFI